MSSAMPFVVSEQEFLSLPESKDKLELLDGEVILSPSPSYHHQLVLRRVAHALEDWAEAHTRSVTIGVTPLSVRFAPDRILQPDIFVTFAETPLHHQGPLERVPEICIEILSTNRAYDRLAKRLVYAESDVVEMWTIGLDGRAERWSGEQLSEYETFTDTLKSPLLPHFRFDLTALPK